MVFQKLTSDSKLKIADEGPLHDTTDLSPFGVLKFQMCSLFVFLTPPSSSQEVFVIYILRNKVKPERENTGREREIGSEREE